MFILDLFSYAFKLSVCVCVWLSYKFTILTTNALSIFLEKDLLGSNGLTTNTQD